MGNGASESINFSSAALLNLGDDALLPQPVYPLWSATTTWHGGVARIYHCDENNHWLPSIHHLKNQITTNTKAIVVINPQQLYQQRLPSKKPQTIADIAQQHQVFVLSDEIYASITQPSTTFIPMANIEYDT